ncbi:MAG: hypothetical protein WCF84_05445 [Anaerolineae bacterium]
MMEPLEIHSTRDLTTHTMTMQGPGVYAYQIDRHQFIAAYSARQHDEAPSNAPFSLTTVTAEQIWMNDRESAQIAAAIRAMRAAVTLD